MMGLCSRQLLEYRFEDLMLVVGFEVLRKLVPIEKDRMITFVYFLPRPRDRGRSSSTPQTVDIAQFLRVEH
jgi:hypothetical protein